VKTYPWKQIASGVTLILLGVLISVAFGKEHRSDKKTTAGSNVTDLDTAKNIEPPASAETPAPAETFATCNPVEVMTYTNRVHVKCSAAIGGIRFFAVSTADSQNASRILSVLSTALVAGRTLNILYDPADLSGVSFGCQTNNCRTIRAVGFGQ